MEERISNTKGITLEINESKSQHNIIKDCSLKGKACKCVSTVVKYINDFPTYITSAQLLHISCKYIFTIETFKNIRYLGASASITLKYILNKLIIFIQKISTVRVSLWYSI